VNNHHHANKENLREPFCYVWRMYYIINLIAEAITKHIHTLKFSQNSIYYINNLIAEDFHTKLEIESLTKHNQTLKF